MSETGESAYPEAPQAAPPPAGDRAGAFAMIDRLAKLFSAKASKGGLGRGPLAELRRLDPSGGVASTCAPFWRIVVEDLEPAKLVDEHGEHDLGKWMAILQGLAEAEGLHIRGVGLGSAMFQAGISEARLTRLLRARGQALLDAVRPLAHQLRSQAKPADWGEVADLVLHQSGSRAKSRRRHIARAYYRAERKQISEAESTGAKSA